MDDDFAFNTVYEMVWQDVEKAAVDGIVERSINPTDTAQALARHVARKAYETAILAAQVDILWAQSEAESFEDFFAGLDVILDERLTATRRLNDRN